MSNKSSLDNQARQFLKTLGKADIVVGIPSYNNKLTIGHVARAAAGGLTRHFPASTALLINSDGGSSDGTSEEFLNTPGSENIHKLATRYQGRAGKGTALKAIFEATAMLNARVCVLVDSDLRSITPEWIKLLAEPIMKNEAGYVTPLYLRHKYDGTITNSLAYPVTRALYGMRVRQPIGGDFGVSGSLAQSYLEKDVWQSAAAEFGIDIFMTTTAINENFDIRQAHLGAKIHDVKDPAASLGPMFKQVVGTMFILMDSYEGKWSGVNRSRAIPTVGPPLEAEPEPVNVTLSALIEKFKEGVKTSRTIWKEFVSDDTVSEVETLARLDGDVFEFPARLWVRVVYDFAVACNSQRIRGKGLEPEEIIDSLTPLYFGRTAGFVRETEHMTCAQAEEVIEKVAMLFEEEKAYLMSQWKKR